MLLRHVFIYIQLHIHAYENTIDGAPLNYYNGRTYAGPAHVTLQDLAIIGGPAPREAGLNINTF